MADYDIASPLLRASDHPDLVLEVVEDDHPQLEPTHQRSSTQTQTHNHNQVPYNGDAPLNSRNPFEFLGSDWPDVPGPSTVDPFLNHTAKIEGLYELVKIVICLPIALARLILFGVCLSIGFLATKLALLGWKDRESPMPKWRCRIMWVTRISSRCILFSFG